MCNVLNMALCTYEYTRKSSCGEPQEAYCPRHNLSKCYLSRGVPHTVLAEGTPSSPGQGVLLSVLARGYPSSPGQGVLHPVLARGYSIQSWPGGTPGNEMAPVEVLSAGNGLPTPTPLPPCGQTDRSKF